ncbi:MAG TPA: LacI family DNA-binding transcriptional regulator [Actinomycetes bacterium]|jgi:DNA-binding LacI/PurR family transcriptional regulator|nr:LacI family DNA-binding transcriptional regulator [Actinomycetes bacterium]
MSAEGTPDHGNQPAATIFEVAEAAGVSITTISHVYSGNRPISERTRRHVLETAERLNYHPHRNARARATGRTMTLALLFSFRDLETVLNPYYAMLLPAMSATAVELGYTFALVPGGPDRDAFVKPLIAGRTVDGAVVLDPRRGDPFVRELVRAEIPFVSAGRFLDQDAGCWVDNDQDRICAEVVAHLAAQGYERVAMITLAPDISYTSDLIVSFSRRVPDGRIAVTANLTQNAGFEAAAGLLSERPRPDALFCINDQLALGALLAARERGVRVPGDVAVVGVCDTVLATHAEPPLTSVRVHPERIGRLLVATIDDALRAGSAAPATLVPAKLVVRRSSNRAGG